MRNTYARNFQPFRTSAGLAAGAALALWACGQAPSSFDDVGAALWEPLDGFQGMMVPDTFEEADLGVSRASEATTDLEADDEPWSSLVDKAVLVGDATLSCSSIPSLTCPDVTLVGSGSLVLGNLIFNRNPPAQLRSTFDSRRASITLDSIICDPNESNQRVIGLRDTLEFRVPVETRATQVSDQTIVFDRTVRPRNYPGAAISSFTCAGVGMTISAPGFRSRRASATGRYVSHRMVADSRTDVDGTGNLLVTCDYLLGTAESRVEKDRPRDVLSVSGNRFVTAETLSASQRRQRCSALCHDDCAEQFGADALGAEACTQTCTGPCVSESIGNLSQCPAPPASCTSCQSVADCGGTANDFQCLSGCCSRVIR